jgi:hypothetical protein
MLGEWRLRHMGRQSSRLRGTFRDKGVECGKILRGIKTKHDWRWYKRGKGQWARSRGVVLDDGRRCRDMQNWRGGRAGVGTKGQAIYWVGGGGATQLNIVLSREGCRLTKGCV